MSFKQFEIESSETLQMKILTLTHHFANRAAQTEGETFTSHVGEGFCVW